MKASVANDLRSWAKGLYPLEAGVEVLIRAFGGRFAQPGHSWIRQGEAAGWWVDERELCDANLEALSGGEQRVLRLVAALLGGHPVSLYETVPGLDRGVMDLILAALAHANGSHEHNGRPVPDPNGRYRSSNGARFSLPRLGSLHPWPELEVGLG